MIKKINKELGTTIFFTSHDVGDIEEVCKRVIIINDGKIVLDDSVRNLKYHYLNKKIVEVNLKRNVKLEEKDGIKVLKAKDTLYKIEVDMNKTSNFKCYLVYFFRQNFFQHGCNQLLHIVQYTQ